MSDLVQHAISFAARAHRHQVRKDGATPYIAHPMRVLFVARDLFGVTDPEILATAVLHDTIEDTTTDFDDLREQFGERVATWVAALTKDSRLPEEKREQVYLQAVTNGGTTAILCKLADMYDNVIDSESLSAEKRAKTRTKIRLYLDQFKTHLTPETELAFQIVETLWNKMLN